MLSLCLLCAAAWGVGGVGGVGGLMCFNAWQRESNGEMEKECRVAQ